MGNSSPGTEFLEMPPRNFEEKVNLTKKLEYHYRASTYINYVISGYLGQKSDKVIWSHYVRKSI